MASSARGRGQVYSTLTVRTADVLAAPEWLTRTRILYLPFVDGALHLSE